MWEDEKGHKFVGLSTKKLWELCQEERDKSICSYENVYELLGKAREFTGEKSVK